MIDSSPKFSFSDKALHLLSGLSEGLIIPLVIATSMQAAGKSGVQILGWGTGLTLIGAIIFSLVSYFAIRHAGNETDEQAMLSRLEISHAAEEHVHEEVAQEEEARKWLHQQESELWKQYAGFRHIIAILNGGGYLLGGLLILAPYCISWKTDYSKIVSVLLALSALIIVGIVKAKLTGQSPFRTALRLALLGMLVTAAAQYIVTVLFT